MKNLFFNLFVIIGLGLTLLSSSCNSSKKVTETDFSDSFKLHPSAYQADFTAYDTDSTWKLSIRFGEEIIFTSKNEKLIFRAPAQPEILAQGINVVKIFGETEFYRAAITIDAAPCNENGFVTDIILEKLNTTEKSTFSGCGIYNGAPHLFDIWALSELNNESIDPSLFRKQVPYMEINLKDKTLSGFGGCNNFNAQLSFSYQKMHLSPIAATKMYCADESKIEREIFSILSGPVRYMRKEQQLILENTTGTLIFKKVD